VLLPHATWRASEGHFVRALQACVHYFSAYPRISSCSAFLITLYPILKKHQIIGYFRYVEDILIIYNQNKTNVEETQNSTNKQPV
jgi:hypothetical protein